MQQYLYVVQFCDHVLTLSNDIMYTIDAHLHGWQHITNSSTWFLFTGCVPKNVNQVLSHDFRKFKFADDQYQILRYGLPACGVQPTVVHGSLAV